MFFQDSTQRIVHLGCEVFLTLIFIYNVVTFFVRKNYRLSVLHLNNDIRTFTCICACQKFNGTILDRLQFYLALFWQFFVCLILFAVAKISNVLLCVGWSDFTIFVIFNTSAYLIEILLLDT